MNLRSRPHFMLAATLIFSFLMWGYVKPIHAAAPGESIISSAGSVPAGSHVTIALYDTGSANVSFKLPASSSTENLTLALMKGTDTIASWKAYSGEHIWGFATIPSGARIEIRNPGLNALPYELAIYARSQLPAIAEGLSSWSGTAMAAGIQSSSQFDVPTAGLYGFSLTAASGAYQLSVDNTTILKTVSASYTPDANDSIYYLSAGTHTFSILQNTNTPQTAWNVALTFLGGMDSLPSAETSGILGGFASQEHIPFMLTEANLVNVRVAVTGLATESVVVSLYNADTKVAESARVFGGEVAWFTGSVAVGSNALYITTTSQSQLGYEMNMSAVANVPATITGIAYGAPFHGSADRSQYRMAFPTSGLYSFQLASSSGRFQFTLGDNFLQRTIDSSAALSFTAFVPEGVQTLSIFQDPAVAASSWSITVNPTDTQVDSLPFTAVSRPFGASGDSYRAEWVPLRFSTAKPANYIIKAYGAASDSISVNLFQGDTQVGTLNTIYGGEALWLSSTIAKDLNRLLVQAAANNTGPISYEISILDIPNIPTNLSGVSYGQGLNSTHTINAPLRGVYTFTVSFSEGAGVMTVESLSQTAAAPSTIVLPANASQTVIRVPLEAGLHTIKITQDAAVTRSAWSLDIQTRQIGPWIVHFPIVRR